MTMYDKYVKQTRTGKKSMAKVKKVAPSRKAMVCLSNFVSARLTALVCLARLPLKVLGLEVP